MNVENDQSYIYSMLREAEIEADLNHKRYTHEEVFNEIRQRLTNQVNEDNV